MSRYRSSLTPQSPGHHKVVTNGVVTTNRSIPKPNVLSKSMTDEVVSRFKERVANGEVFNNAFSSATSEFLANDTYHATSFQLTNPALNDDHLYSNGSLFTLLYQTPGGLPFPVAVVDADLARRNAREQAIASVNKTTFDSLNFIGEWSKTKRLHRDVGNSLLKIAKEGSFVSRAKDRLLSIPLYDANGNVILKRNGKAVTRSIHDGGKSSSRSRSKRSTNVANAYLIQRFGVGPLINDLNNAVKFLGSGRKLRQTARGSSFVTKQSEYKFLHLDGGSRHPVTLTTTRTLSIRVGILYETDPISRGLAQLGLTRPLSSAWELTPWSFVVDRFVNVGRWLDAIQPAGFVKILCAWESTTESVVYTASVDSTYSGVEGGRQVHRTWSGGLLVKNTTKKRVQLTDLSIPKLPVIDGDISSMHCLDYAALVLQKLGLRTGTLK